MQELRGEDKIKGGRGEGQVTSVPTHNGDLGEIFRQTPCHPCSNRIGLQGYNVYGDPAGSGPPHYGPRNIPASGSDIKESEASVFFLINETI
ncbi:MAG: hypothetical protein A2253_08175 [Deltaproteobacteria bacterium RIFOXYA2_FULL_55_11]|nr:MAG: hypothetical protein A2253_08175 [Deltaproteobacteria bacterium RIFOXYA2_FULL_55_11]